MDKALLKEFILRLKKMEGKEYLFSVIAYETAPTLGRIKPSSLISFSTTGKNLYELWHKNKDDVCMSLGLCYFELKQTKNSCLVLFYISEVLEKVITCKKSIRFLKEMNYCETMTLEQSLQLLKTRFESLCPHEVGVFLGIPVEDVVGFIEHNGGRCLSSGYWKVYHEPERAGKTFQRFDRAKITAIHSIMRRQSICRSDAAIF